MGCFLNAKTLTLINTESMFFCFLKNIYIDLDSTLKWHMSRQTVTAVMLWRHFREIGTVEQARRGEDQLLHFCNSLQYLCFIIY